MHGSCDNVMTMMCMFIRVRLRHGELVRCGDTSIRKENAIHVYTSTELHLKTFTA
jgi:hypothetical protein